MVEPELTARALGVTPLADATWSTAADPETPDTPLYSSTAIAISASDVGFAVTVGRLPSAWLVGAVHTLNSWPFAPCTEVASVKGSPAESVTLSAVACIVFRTATSTTSRSPRETSAGRVAERPLTPEPRTLTRWTNRGGTAALGVTGRDAADGGPLPAAVVAVTVKV